MKGSLILSINKEIIARISNSFNPFSLETMIMDGIEVYDLRVDDFVMD